MSEARDLSAIRWACKPWAALTLDELYDALALRCRVFILEQGPYQDPDGLDQVSLHVFGRDAAGVLQAYCRLVAPGHKYGEPSMGRVIVSPEWRGTGLGHPLVAQALQAADATWPGQPNRISAQSHLAAFYGRHGYLRVSDDYLEDGIPHCEMLRPA